MQSLPEPPGDLPPSLADRAPYDGGPRGATRRFIARLIGLRDSPTARRAFKGGSWSLAGYGTSIALRFISRLVLAKLLIDASPMGDVALVSTILAGLEMISDLGIGINVVQHPRGTEARFLGTAFSIQLLRSLGVWAVASALALPVAALYHEPALGPLLLFAACSALFRGFVNPRIHTLTREVQLRWPTLLTASSEVAGFAVTIGWALVHPSAWAIVGGSVATALWYAAGSHLALPTLKPEWDRSLASQIMRFGGWTVLSTGTFFLASRGENLILKGAIPDVEFGCFAFASMLVTTPVAALSQLGSQVFFPLLSSAARENDDLARRRYWLGKVIFSALAAFVGSGSIIFGPAAVGLLHLNRSYESLGWMVQWLGVRAALDVYTAPVIGLLFAHGQVRYAAMSNVLRLMVLLVGLAITVAPFGLRGAMWVLVGGPFLSYAAFLPGLRNHAPGGMRLEAVAQAVFLGSIAISTLVQQGHIFGSFA